MHATLRFLIPSLFIGGALSAYDYVVVGGGNGCVSDYVVVPKAWHLHMPLTEVWSSRVDSQKTLVFKFWSSKPGPTPRVYQRLVIKLQLWIRFDIRHDFLKVFVPGLAGGAPSLNWAYKTVPQENMNGRQLSVSAGRGLGGSTLSKPVSFIVSRLTKSPVYSQ